MRRIGHHLDVRTPVAKLAKPADDAGAMRTARIAAIALLAAASAQAETRSLAVLEFRNKLAEADRANVDAAYLAGQVRIAAVKAAPSLRVMTKENLIVL